MLERKPMRTTTVQLLGAQIRLAHDALEATMAGVTPAMAHALPPGIANPLGAIWAAAMMLSYLGWPAWEQRILSAIERVIAQGECLPRDQGGHATTREVGKAVAAVLT